MNKIFSISLKLMVALCVVYMLLWAATIAIAAAPPDMRPSLTLFTDQDVFNASTKLIITLVGVTSSLLVFIFLYAVGLMYKRLEKLDFKFDSLLIEISHKVDRQDCIRKHNG